MAHQCLKCGTLFEDGSTQILRGCPDCKGTRFFYTDQALPEAERQRLFAQGQEDLANILTNLSETADDAEVEAETDGDWLVAKRPEPPVQPPSTQPPTAAGQARFLPGNRLMIRMKKRRLARRVKQAHGSIRWDYEAPPDAAAQAPPKVRAKPVPAPHVQTERKTVEAVSYADEPPATDSESLEPLVEKLAPLKFTPPPAFQDSASTNPADGVPETVRIEGPGRYEIDVRRLLEEAPIVVHKDGSYLIHLPSLFDADEAR